MLGNYVVTDRWSVFSPSSSRKHLLCLLWLLRSEVKKKKGTPKATRKTRGGDDNEGKCHRNA